MSRMSAGPSLSLSIKISVIAEQVSCELRDEVVILSVRDGVYYSLNSVAARVWQLIQEPRTVAEVRDIIQKEYEVEEQQCTQDLVELVTCLKDWNLIEYDLHAATDAIR